MKTRNLARGQIALEYVIVIVVIILVFSTVSLDLIGESQSDVKALSRALFERTGKSAIQSAGSLVSLQGAGAKRTIFIRAPPSCVFVVLPDSVVEYCEPASAPFSYAGKPLSVSLQGVSYACPNCLTEEYVTSFSCGPCVGNARDYGAACSASASCFQPVVSSGRLIKPSGELLEISKSG